MGHLGLHRLLQEIRRKRRTIRQEILIHLPVLGTPNQRSRYGN